VPGSLDFRVTGAGAITDMSKYGNCVASALNDDLTLHIPQLQFLWANYWFDFRYGGDLIFTITNAGAM
jgi:hypothetical protein